MYTRLIIVVLIVAAVVVNTATAQTTVASLATSNSRVGCGTQKLCLAQPTNCDPSTSASCDFISSQQLNGQNYQLGLSGSSPGYIAIALSTSTVGSNDTTYICANNNGTVQFFVAYLNGNVPTLTSTASVSSVNGSANGTQIQCIVNATLPAGMTKALNFQVGFLTGNYINGTLGNATVIFQQSVDLSNPTSTGSTNTTASNATTQSPPTTTTAAFPVAPLATSISRVGCGTQKLCLAQPTNCDPSTSASCDLFSSQQLSGQLYQLGLSGSSLGYIATALSTSTVGSNDTTYICANNNGTVQFFVAYLSGNVLTTTSTGTVSSVNGSVNGNQIQCIFNATLPAGSTKALNFQVGYLTGNYTNGTLGNATVIFQKFVDLSSPTGHAITFKQSLTQAMLIVMVALRLTM